MLSGTIDCSGRLAGPAHNRVRIEKIRGVISQGLCYPVQDGKIKGVDVEEGQDVTDLLGLIKYDPPVPKEMAGQAEAAYGKTIKYELRTSRCILMHLKMARLL